jgi:hypothetical protein
LSSYITIRRSVLLLTSAWLFAPPAAPYIRSETRPGVYISRSDFSNVQFLLNQNFAPGFTNNDGNVVITPDSDVMGALNAALATWNSVPTSAVQFAPVQSTTLINNISDGHDVIVMADSPAIRSMVGPTLAALTVIAAAGTSILDSDIIFNPVLTFSSTLAPNTYDLQSSLTKQLGNALGAANSAVVGAALFIDSSHNETVKRTLSPDDIAFLSTIYPAQGITSPFGTITGTLTMNGAPVKDGLVSFLDPAAGTPISVLSSEIDGTWSFAAPPGNYVVYAEPLLPAPQDFPNLSVRPGYVGLTASDATNPNFQPSFLGGNGSATTITVTAGASTDASFSPAPPGGGPLTLLTVSAVTVGGFPSQFALTPSPNQVVSGGAVDFIIEGEGIDNTITDSSILLLGPLSLRPGSTKAVTAIPPLNVNGMDFPFVRFTVDIPAVTAQSYATLIVSNNGTYISYIGGIVILPPQ